MSTFLVIGASGTVGTSLVPLLQAGGHQVRAATHRTPADASQVHLNLLTGQGLEPALEGVDAAFLLSPPGHVNPHELLGPVVQTAARQGVGKLVLMSAMGADADPNGPLRRVELQLQDAGVRWNVIRPNWFMQNFHTFWLQGIREQGAILLPTGRARGSFIDARDIAAVAAALMTGSTHDGQAFDLTGSEALDHDEVAAILSEATGRRIRYQEVTPAQMLQGLLQAGLPQPYAEFLLVILGFFKAGYAERTTDAVQRITGQPPRSLQAYARDHRAAWV